MLLSRKSSYHQIKPQIKQFSSSMNKTLSIYAQQANDNKYLQENMLNKLLRPPIKKKYDPQFQKPDVEKLIHQNNLLKQQITSNKKVIMELKLKLRDMEKKISKLEQNQSQQLSQIIQRQKSEADNETKIRQREQQIKYTKLYQNNQQEGDHKFNKRKQNGSVHTQILKKKIQQLHSKWVSAQTQIKRLRKLPSSSIFQENNIQKQHLLAETIRLKSILTPYESTNSDPATDIIQNKLSYTDVNQNIASSINNAKFQQQFLKMLKQQNQKLKATIRLLENDKILMKARQTTQIKQSNDLKKQLQQIKNKLTRKQSQIQKLSNQNQNLLFKKAAQFRLQKQDKQNKLIFELSKTIQQLRSQKKKITQENQELIVDNLHLKEKQKNKNSQLMEKDQQLQKIKVQIAQIRNDYEARIKSLQMNKIHTKDSGFGMKSSKGRFNETHRIGYQRNFGKHQCIEQNKEKNNKVNWGKPIKFEELDFCILKIWSLKQEKQIQKYQDIFRIGKNLKASIIKFEELYNIFKSAPLNIQAKHSRKLAKYIFSDHYEVQNQNNIQQPVIDFSLVITIIKAAINQFTQCLNDSNVINSWKCFLSKSKKMIRELQQLKQQFLTKDQFIQIVIRNKTTTLQLQQINFMLLYGFCWESSTEEIILNRKKILQCMYGLMGDPKYLTSIFIRSGFTHFLPQSSCNTNSEQNMTSIEQKKVLNQNNVFESIYAAIEKGVNRAQTIVYNKCTRQNILESKKAKTQTYYDLRDIGLSQFQNNNEKQQIDDLQQLKMLNIQKVCTQQDQRENYGESNLSSCQENSIIHQQNQYTVSESKTESKNKQNSQNDQEQSNIFNLQLGQQGDQQEQQDDDAQYSASALDQ